MSAPAVIDGQKPRAIPLLAADRFALALDHLGPFEPSPLIAVACSGGPDSLALLALTQQWASVRDGRAVAIVIDHRLRAASPKEAHWVAATAKLLGADATMRAWERRSEERASAAAARDARYRYLDAACQDLGILHVLTGHHRQDQAETVHMRQLRGAPRRMQGMARVRELAHCRILRPVLDWLRDDLREVAAQLGTGWIEDPSNRSDAYERNRLRASLEAKPSDTTGSADDRQGLMDGASRAWLARWCQRSANGLMLPAAALEAAPAEAVIAGLRRMLLTVGGGVYLPAEDAARRLLQGLKCGRGVTTLNGCCIQRLGDAFLVEPELGRDAGSKGRQPLAALSVVAGPLSETGDCISRNLPSESVCLGSAPTDDVAASCEG